MDNPSFFPNDLVGLPKRKSLSSKTDYGRILVVGGATGMAGAPAMCGSAAMRSGAGLVELSVPECIAVACTGFDPCLMTHARPSSENGTFSLSALDSILERTTRCDVIVCGPGMGRSEAVRAIVSLLWREALVPAVFDADAISALATESSTILQQHAGPRIITPHEGEWRRLQPTPQQSDRKSLETAAETVARFANITVLLKGSRTLVTQGDRSWHNPTGNPGMATAGSGDVLSGILAALIGQGLDTFDAARLATWIHGAAGDAAARRFSQVSMTARDIIDCLPEIFLSLEKLS